MEEPEHKGWKRQSGTCSSTQGSGPQEDAPRVPPNLEEGQQVWAGWVSSQSPPAKESAPKKIRAAAVSGRPPSPY